jgi:hypothetical protein
LYYVCSCVFSDKNQKFAKKITLNSKYMIDFEKIDDLSFMIDDIDSKKLTKIKKYGKKSIKHRKRIKKNK